MTFLTIIQLAACIIALLVIGYHLADIGLKFDAGPYLYWIVGGIAVLFGVWLTTLPLDYRVLNTCALFVVVGAAIRWKKYPLPRDKRRLAIQCAKVIAEDRGESPKQNFRCDFEDWGAGYTGENDFDSDLYAPPLTWRDMQMFLVMRYKVTETEAAMLLQGYSKRLIKNDELEPEFSRQVIIQNKPAQAG